MRKSKKKGNFVSKFQLIKTFIKTRKFPKLLRDGLLIFVSVFFATWATNYREHYTESKKYGSTLLLFRDEIHENIRKFRYTYDSSLIHFSDTSYINYYEFPPLVEQKKTVSELLVLLKEGNKNSEIEAINILKQIQPWIDWRHTTGISEILLNIYSDFILEDSLFFDILSFHNIMEKEFIVFHSWGENIKKIKSLMRAYIDFDEWDNESFQFVNLKELFLDDYILFKNLVRNLSNINLGLIELDKNCAAFFNEFTLKLDKVLDKRGIAVGQRNNKWIMEEE